MKNELSWDTRLRFKLIEVVALWEGRLTTNHLCNSFNIKRQQASRDINHYQSLFQAPPLVHDRSIKGYRPTAAFKPTFTKGTPDEYLSLLHRYGDNNVDGLNIKSLGNAESVVVSVPERKVDPIIIQRLLQAAREQRRVDVDYVSLTQPIIRGRNIVPHTIVFDGFRWHVRAYCEERKAFRDFVLSRFRNEPELIDKSDISKHLDHDWMNEITFEVIANPYLSSEQQQIVQDDYHMRSSPFIVTCRKALAKYFVKRLDICLDNRKLQKSPKRYQLTVTEPKNIRSLMID